MKNNKFKKLMTTLTISTVLVSSTGMMALAVNNTKTTKPAATQSAQNTGTPNQNNQGFRGRGQFDIKPVLDKLVKSKTITAAQETKIIAYQTKQNAARQAQRAKLGTMTQAQRQQYFAKQGQNNGNGGQRQSQFADLVKNKTITQKQSDAISAAISAARPNFGNRINNGQPNTNSNN